MWNLQLEEFEYWMQGYIKDEIYDYWMLLRRKKYEKPHKIVFQYKGCNITYKNDWDHVKKESCLKKHKYPFQKFMDEILQIYGQRDIGDILKEYKPLG